MFWMWVPTVWRLMNQVLADAGVVPDPAELGEVPALRAGTGAIAASPASGRGRPCGAPLRAACRGGHAGNQIGRGFQAEGGVDQHQVEAEAGEVREGVLGRQAAAGHLMDLVARGQRLQRLVE
jgi:hypothetical protein